MHLGDSMVDIHGRIQENFAHLLSCRLLPGTQKIIHSFSVIKVNPSSLSSFSPFPLSPFLWQPDDQNACWYWEPLCSLFPPCILLFPCIRQSLPFSNTPPSSYRDAYRVIWYIKTDVSWCCSPMEWSYLWRQDIHRGYKCGGKHLRDLFKYANVK